MTITAQQLEVRKTGLGASDIAAALGFNPFKSQLQLFMEKTGQIEPDDLSQNMAVRMGNKLEPVIGEIYEEENNVKLRRVNETLYYREDKWLMCHLDFKLAGEKKAIECKAPTWHARQFWGESGTDQVPDMYLIQLATQMMIADYPEGDLAVLIAGNDYRQYPFERDKSLEEMIYRKSKEFWFNNVLAGNQPEANCDDDLALMYARDSGKEIVATDDIEAKAHELSIIKDQIKVLEKQKNESTFEIKKFIGDNMALLGSDGKALVTYKNNKDGVYFDKGAFKKSMPNTYEAFCEPKPGARVFRLKV